MAGRWQDAARHWLRWIAFPVVAGLVSWLPCLRGGFVWDDSVTVTRLLSRMATMRQIFLPSTNLLGIPFYKPIASLFFWFDFHVYGLNAHLWHLDGLLLHLISVVGVFHLSRRWLGGARGWEKPAMVGAALFAVWPACAEPIAWISARSELVIGALVGPALCLHLDARDRGRTSLPAAALFFLMLGAKETALAFVPIAIAATVLLPRMESGAERAVPVRRREALASALWLPYLLAYVGYAAIRRAVLGPGSALSSVGASTLHAFDAGLVSRAWGFYVREALLAGHGAPYVESPPGGAVTAAFAVAGAAALIAALAVGGRAIFRLLVRDDARTGFPEGLAMGLAWFFGFLAPALVVVNAPMTVTLVAERYLYLPCMALGPVVALAVSRLPERATGRRAAAALGAVVLALGVAGVRRLAPWRSEEALWTRAVADNRLSMLGNENLAAALQGRGDLASAEDHARLACYLSPAVFEAERPWACLVLLEIYLQERKLPDARRTAIAASKFSVSEEAAAKLLSAAAVIQVIETAQDASGMQVPRGMVEREIPTLERAADLDPLDQVSRQLLAEYYRALGEPVRARQRQLELATLAVGEPSVRKTALDAAAGLQAQVDGETDPLKKLYFQAEQAEIDGRLDDAIDAWRRALAIEPARPDLLVPLADDLANTGRLGDAIQTLRDATGAVPDSPKVWFNLGLYLRRAGDLQGDADAMQKALSLRPDWPQAHLQRGLALDGLGDRTGAIAEYRGYLADSLGDPAIHDAVQQRLHQLQAP